MTSSFRCGRPEHEKWWPDHLPVQAMQRQTSPLLHPVFPAAQKMGVPNISSWKSVKRSSNCGLENSGSFSIAPDRTAKRTVRDKNPPRGLARRRHRINATLMAALLAVALSAAAGTPCRAAGEPIQWIADYCMLRMETDDEIAVSGCIEEQTKFKFRNACASNTHFKKAMCAQMLRNGTRTGTLDQCLKDPKFKGRTVAAGGVGA